MATICTESSLQEIFIVIKEEHKKCVFLQEIDENLGLSKDNQIVAPREKLDTQLVPEGMRVNFLPNIQKLTRYLKAKVPQPAD